MKTIHCSQITEVVSELCINANYFLPKDMMNALKTSRKKEVSEKGKNVLSQLIENATVAKTERMPMCQDTGMTVIFVELGQDVRIEGGFLSDAINSGVALGYEKGYLRKSVVKDPLVRENTGDNTPAVIHYELVPGDKLKITVTPKGFGSENMSTLKMLKPSDGIEGIKAFVVQTVEAAGPNACPPIVLGIGLGGTMEKAAILAKKSLLRPLKAPSPFPHIAELEEMLLAEVNKLGIGPAGFGGRTTAIAVHIEPYPTHIAGLPIAVNICCHALRHSEHEF